MSTYTCSICGEAISNKELKGEGCLDKSNSYSHWLECTSKARKRAYALLNSPIPSTAHAGYGLCLSHSTARGPVNVTTEVQAGHPENG